MSEQLKPCPFCGCTDILVKTRKTTIIECGKCGSVMFDYQNGVQRDVRAAWNARADAAALSRLRDTQRVLVEALRGMVVMLPSDAPCLHDDERIPPSFVAVTWRELRIARAALASVEQPGSVHLTPAGDEEVTARETALRSRLESMLFHPSASHVAPDYRDGYNHALRNVLELLATEAAMQEPKP